ncbi:MAG: helix-turn-helix domain-containing protein, partial [Paracoccaceae bacterium]
QISLETIELVSNIRDIMAEYKSGIRDKYRFYSQDLLNNLFHHPYTRIEYVMNELGVSRPTASRYLEELARGGFLERIESGRNVYYVNTPLVSLFSKSFGP